MQKQMKAVSWWDSLPIITLDHTKIFKMKNFWMETKVDPDKQTVILMQLLKQMPEVVQ